MYKHFHEQPSRPSALNPRLSETIDPVLLRALAKRPETRFPSILQFVQAFEQALLQETATLVRTPMPTPPVITRTRLVPQPQPQSGMPPMPTPVPREGDPASAGIGNYRQGNNSGFPQFPDAQVPTILRPQEQRPAQTITPPVVSFHPVQQEKAPARPAFLPRLLVIGLIALVVLAGSGFLLTQITGWPFGSGKPVAATATPGKVDSAATQVAQQKDASATALTQANASLTAIANDPYLSGKGTLLLNDSLSEPGHWQAGTSGRWGGTCFFKNGAYHIEQTIGPDRRYPCDAGSLQASNFIYEVQVKILQGTCGGMRFRMIRPSILATILASAQMERLCSRLCHRAGELPPCLSALQPCSKRVSIRAIPSRSWPMVRGSACTPTSKKLSILRMESSARACSRFLPATTISLPRLRSVTQKSGNCSQ